MIKQLFIITTLFFLKTYTSYAQINPYEYDQTLAAIATVEDIPPHLSIADVWLLRNYIFAKEKYKFKNAGLRMFYEQHYDVVGIYEDVSDRFTAREHAIIKELKRREQLLREEKAWDVIGDHTFKIVEGKLIVDDNSTYALNTNQAKYISIKQLDPTLYSIQIESEYRIDTTGCCDEIGATNAILQLFFFDLTTQQLTEVPDHITIDKTIDKVMDQHYIFVLNTIFSGAHDLEIYDYKTFALLNSLQQIESISYVDPDYIEIWCFTDREVEYPYKYIRKHVFSEGVLKNTEVEEKVQAEWYFAG